MYREGDYTGKGENKPKGSDGTPPGAWNNKKLTRMGMELRNTFKDVCFLRRVHRHSTADASVPSERHEEYRKDADRFLKVMSGM